MLWQTGFFFLMNALFFFFYFRSRYQFYSDCFCHDHADFPLQESGRSAFLCLLVQVDFTVSWLPALKKYSTTFFLISAHRLRRWMDPAWRRLWNPPCRLHPLRQISAALSMIRWRSWAAWVHASSPTSVGSPDTLRSHHLSSNIYHVRMSHLS